MNLVGYENHRYSVFNILRLQMTNELVYFKQRKTIINNDTVSLLRNNFEIYE